MARWDLPQYQSVYRDLGSVAVNTELRKRYVQNFAASDALAGAVGDMEALDFEGDQAAKERLSGKYNAELDLMSAQGDYEHMGRKTATLARGFIKDYKPVQTNKAKFDAYMKNLDDARALGVDKGGLDETDYMGLKAKARHGYAGLQYNEDGVLDEDSYFAGQGYVKSVDLNALVNEQLKNIKPNAWKDLGTDIPLPDMILDKNGNIELIQEINKKGQIVHYVTTKGGKKYVSGKRVQEIVERIIHDPNVQLGINQKADVMSFDMSPEDASTAAETILDEIDTKVEEVLAGTGLFEINPETKKPYTQEERNELVDILKDNKEILLLKQANEGDLSVVRANIKAELEANAKAIAIGTHAFSEEEFGKTYRWDKKALHDATQAVDTSTKELSVIMKSDALPGLGGATAESKRKFIGDTDVSITADLDILRNGLEKTTGEVITNEQLLDRLLEIDNAEQYTELAESYNMSPKKLQQIASGILINKTKRDLVTQRINEVEADLQEKGLILTDKEFNKKFGEHKEKEVLGTGAYFTGLDLKNAMIKAGMIDKNATIKDALKELYRTDPTGRSQKILQNDALMAALNEAHRGTVPEKYSDAQALASLAYVARGHVTKYGEYVSKRDALADEVYSKETKKDAWHMTHFAPNKSHVNTKETQAALSSLFKGSFPEGITFINPNGGADLSLDEYFDESSWWGEWEEDKLEIQHEKIGLANVSRADGTPVLVVPVKDKTTGKVRNALINASSVKTGGYLESWINSAEYQMHSLFAQGEHAQLDTPFSPPIFDNVLFDYKHPSGPSVIITMTQEKWDVYKKTLPSDHPHLKEDRPQGRVYTKDEGLQILANAYASKGFANSFEDLYNNQ